MTAVRTIFSRNRAAYSVITAFLFVIIFLVVALGIVYYGTFITNVTKISKDDLNQYELAKDARNRIVHCYGNVLDPDKFDEPCNIPLIKGFKISRLELKGCTPLEYAEGSQDGVYNKFSYAFAIKDSEKVCLGSLELFL